MNSKKKLAVFYHIFYEDSILDIADQLYHLSYFHTTFFFNISSEAPDQLEIRHKLLESFPGSIITISPNQGKDIGGKLMLMKACIEARTDPDWIVFLHDKKSLQALNASTWKNDLLKIIEKDFIYALDTIISTEARYGIIAAEHYVIKEIIEQGKFVGKNGPILENLVKEYRIICNSYDYVAGTMFWAKASPLIDFFKDFDPLTIRQTLESGNVLDNFGGTYTHAWERMLSWIIVSKGLTIKTI